MSLAGLIAALNCESTKCCSTATCRHFTGSGPDDRDCGFDNSYNCSLFAVVVYATVEVAPDSAAICLGPAASSYKLLQLFDKIQ